MQARGNTIKGALLVLFGAMLWGTTGTSQALAPTGATSLEVGALRVVIGGAVLLTFALVKRSFKGLGKWPKIPAALAILSTAAYQPFFFTGTARTGVAVGTLTALASAPVITGLLGYFTLRERPSKIWYLSSLLAIGGCTLLTLSGDAGSTVNPVGMLYSVGAGASYAIFVLSSKYLVKDRPPDAVNGVIFGGAGLVMLPVLLVNPPAWLADPRGLAVALHLGLFATALPYFLFLKGLTMVPASTSVTLTAAEPLTASLLGVFLLGERMNALGWAGIVLTFAGVSLLALQGEPDEQSGP
ncbi:MAG: EamA family transporter [Synergistaceae bacterium]|nr:EamA family transporter [Synergistaceae bacterium]